MNNGICRMLAIGWLGLFLVTSVACDDDDEPESQPAASGTAMATTDEFQETATGTFTDAGPATFRVLAGATDANIDVEAFMPANMSVRVGDSIEWTAHGFEGHTVTFGDDDDVLASIGDYLVPNPNKPEEVIFNPKLSLPSEKQGTHDGGSDFMNSGFFGVPVEQQYSLMFTKAGLYTYLCLVHPFTMTGTVAVEEEGVQVPSPESIAAAAAEERQAYEADLEAKARELNDNARTAAGFGAATIHYVQVGAITDHGQVAVYTPGGLDIKAGDTVIFENDDRNFHNVIFKGDRPEYPPGIGIVPDPAGLNFSLDNASAIAVDPPPEGFDETTFLSSGSMGVTQPRLTWTLRFDTPGAYVYACTIHTLAGMTGIINVE